ncbi:MAG TPA: FAD-dependent oxidoreductase [Pilimelia sp.]|nr:FAD-dependent oxidoreductase [Pilimelia sp.]
MKPLPGMDLVIVGGSDAGIAAALRVRELDPRVEVTVLVADGYPNYSICGIPYHISGEVPDARTLAHRSIAELEATGMRLRLDTTATAIDPTAKRVTLRDPAGVVDEVAYDRLIVATGAAPQRPPIDGLDTLGPQQGLHVLHTMGDTFAVTATLARRRPSTAAIVGAGYIGLEMAEALTTRGLRVTIVEQLPQVLSTVDPQLGADLAAELRRHDVTVHTDTPIRAVKAHDDELVLLGDGTFQVRAGLVLVVTGVRPDTTLAAAAGVATTGPKGAIAVDRHMRTNIPDIYAAGDCVLTHHRLLGESYLPLGTTAHKQGRVAGENAVGGDREFAGSLGTQVVRVFDLVAARTGLRHAEAADAGFDPATTDTTADDHKVYYPDARPVRVRLTADRRDRRLLGVQMLGAVPTCVAKRIDTAAAALYAGLAADDLVDLDLSYTPPLGTPWDVLQNAALDWQKAQSLPHPAG